VSRCERERGCRDSASFYSRHPDGGVAGASRDAALGAGVSVLPAARVRASDVNKSTSQLPTLREAASMTKLNYTCLPEERAARQSR